METTKHRKNMKTTEIYNKFYNMLYDGIIDEFSIGITDVDAYIKEHQSEFEQLCIELCDRLISDRERLAFYLTMEFINA